MTVAEELDTNTLQAARLASELDDAIRQLERVIANLERGSNGARSGGYRSRLRAQIKTKDAELAALNRMRSNLRARFGV